MFYNKPLPYPQQIPLDNLDLGLNQTYYGDNTTLPQAIDTIQQVFVFLTINQPIYKQTNNRCCSYLKEYRNAASMSDVGVFTNSRLTSIDRVKSLVRAFRVYYTTKEGYENAVDYLTSRFGEEQLVLDGYYDNVSETLYPYNFGTLGYNAGGVQPSWKGATA